MTHQTGAGLIEGDVTVRSNASQEEIDTTDGLDLGLVLCALCLQILCIPVEDVDVLWSRIDVIE